MASTKWNEFPLTNFLQMLVEPPDANDDNQDVDEAEIGKHGNEVDVQLLIQL